MAIQPRIVTSNLTGCHGSDPTGRREAASVGGRPHQRLVLSPARGRLRGQGVTARAIVVLRDGWLQFRQIGALVPVGVAARKKNQSVRGLVLAA